MACLDTTFLLDLSGRGSEARRESAQACAQRLAARGDPLVTTRLNVAELWIGVHLSASPSRERARVKRVLAGLGILEFNAAAARLYGQVEAGLRRRGERIGDIDALIGCIALENGQTLVTRNVREFSRIPGLVVETY